MSKEAEQFFIQKTIENATCPRIKESLALINREEEGRIMQEYADLQGQNKQLCECMLPRTDSRDTFIKCHNCGKKARI